MICYGEWVTHNYRYHCYRKVFCGDPINVGAILYIGLNGVFNYLHLIRLERKIHKLEEIHVFNDMIRVSHHRAFLSASRPI